MQLLYIQACADKFSYDDLKPMRSLCAPLDCSSTDLTRALRDYEAVFQRGDYSAMKILRIEVDDATHSIYVLDNRELRNPLKVKKIINPAVAEMRAKKVTAKKSSESIPALLNELSQQVAGDHFATVPGNLTNPLTGGF